MRARGKLRRRSRTAASDSTTSPIQFGARTTIRSGSRGAGRRSAVSSERRRRRAPPAPPRPAAAASSTADGSRATARAARAPSPRCAVVSPCVMRAMSAWRLPDDFHSQGRLVHEACSGRRDALRSSTGSSAHPVFTARAAATVVVAAGRPKNSTKIPSASCTFWSTSMATPAPWRSRRRMSGRARRLEITMLPERVAEARRAARRGRGCRGAAPPRPPAPPATPRPRRDISQLPKCAVTNTMPSPGRARPLDVLAALLVDEGEELLLGPAVQPEDVEEGLPEVRVDGPGRAQPPRLVPVRERRDAGCSSAMATWRGSRSASSRPSDAAEGERPRARQAAHERLHGRGRARLQSVSAARASRALRPRRGARSRKRGLVVDLAAHAEDEHGTAHAMARAAAPRPWPWSRSRRRRPSRACARPTRAPPAGTDGDRQRPHGRRRRSPAVRGRPPRAPGARCRSAGRRARGGEPASPHVDESGGRRAARGTRARAPTVARQRARRPPGPPPRRSPLTAMRSRAAERGRPLAQAPAGSGRSRRSSASTHTTSRSRNEPEVLEAVVEHVDVRAQSPSPRRGRRTARSRPTATTTPGSARASMTGSSPASRASASTRVPSLTTSVLAAERRRHSRG